MGDVGKPVFDLKRLSMVCSGGGREGGGGTKGFPLDLEGGVGRMRDEGEEEEEGGE